MLKNGIVNTPNLTFHILEVKMITTGSLFQVHMGVHMWSSTQPSRRGRRMSLEMPHPPIPLTAKDSEFLQRRPELFFPYLQTPFSSAPPMTVSLFRFFHTNDLAL